MFPEQRVGEHVGRGKIAGFPDQWAPRGGVGGVKQAAKVARASKHRGEVRAGEISLLSDFLVLLLYPLDLKHRSKETLFTTIFNI